MPRRIAVLLLSCRDYEAMELTLACHMRYSPEAVRYFILQNCRGGYDAERTLAVAYRYEKLFPHRITVVDTIEAGPAYKSIRLLLESEVFQGFDLVCKVDDDAFPICEGWLDGLLDCYEQARKEVGDKLAYVTPLINNNTWGFPHVIKAMCLEEEYYATQARIHIAGAGDTGIDRRRIAPANEIWTGQDGTIWGYPYIARWLHTRTTLNPDAFIAAAASLSDMEVPANRRYSIGCILFEKELWSKIDNGGSDDEAMMLAYCDANGLHIRSRRSIPFVHIAYFTQREENRDIVETARDLYSTRLNHPFPISLKQNRLLEIEARLRWLETRSATPSNPNSPAVKKKKRRIFKEFRSKLFAIAFGI